MDTEVSLDEVLKVLGEEPIDERAAWGVLVQSYKALQLWAEYSTPGSQLFIAPESLQLHRNGYITFAMGIPHPPSSKYMAPEVSSKSSLDSSDQQKSCIYSLGMVITTAVYAEDTAARVPPLSPPLVNCLAHMTTVSQNGRPSLDELAGYLGEDNSGAEEAVADLVSHVLGEPQRTAYDDEILESELQGDLDASYDAIEAHSDTSDFGNHGKSLMYTSLPAIVTIDLHEDSSRMMMLHSPSDSHLSATHNHSPQQKHHQNQEAVAVCSFGPHFYTPSRRKKETRLIARPSAACPITRSSSEGKPICDGDAHANSTGKFRIDNLKEEICDPSTTGGASEFEEPSQVGLSSNIDISTGQSYPTPQLLVAAAAMSDEHTITNLAQTTFPSNLTSITTDPTPSTTTTDPNPTITTSDPTPTTSDPTPTNSDPTPTITSEPNPTLAVHETPTKQVRPHWQIQSSHREILTHVQKPSSTEHEQKPSSTEHEQKLNPTEHEQKPSVTEIEQISSPIEKANSTEHKQSFTLAEHGRSGNPTSPEHKDVMKKVGAPREQFQEAEGQKTNLPKDHSKSDGHSIEKLPPQQGMSLLSLHTSPKIEESNRTSMKKLGHILGSDFCTFNGISLPKTSRKSPRRQLSSQRRFVEVVLLNGQSMTFEVEVTSTCRELFDQVVALQSLEESYIFGLAMMKTSKDLNEVFLEFDHKLSQHASKQWNKSTNKWPHLKLLFRVKYYVENVNQLQLDTTRHLYYLQLRRDILESKTYCTDQTALKLAAYAIQAELGDWSGPDKHHYQLQDYLPSKVTVKLGETATSVRLGEFLAELRGLPPAEAQLGFMMECQSLPEYGMVFYQVATSKKERIGAVWLGLSVRGIVMYCVHKEVKTPFTHWPWSELKNLSYTDKKFSIEEDSGKTNTFYAESHKIARYILHLSIYYHRFQLLSKSPASPWATGIDQPPHDGTRHQKNKGEAKLCQEERSHPQVVHDYDEKGSQAILRLPDGEIYDIELIKTENSLGLRLAGGYHKPIGGGYVYVKSIALDSIADKSCVKENDIVMKVDSQNLHGLTHKDAASFISQAKHSVSMKLLRPTDRKWLNKPLAADQSWTEAHWSDVTTGSPPLANSSEESS